MTLTEFLLARIAEDRSRSVHATGCPYGLSGGVDDCECREGQRNRAECEAKRLIIELHGSQLTTDGRPYWSPELRALAAVYADHPDYREEWRG